MTRDPNIFGDKRFIGNTNKNVFHDLNNEKTGENECQIDEIKIGHIKTFDPDTEEQAIKEKFDRCDYCFDLIEITEN